MIYLDNNATTVLDPAVLKTMLEDLKDGAAYNPSASHAMGRKAAVLLFKARKTIACLFQDISPDEVIFTSSATEAINLAMRSFAVKGSHIITSDLEHSAVCNTALDLKETQNVETTFIPAGKTGAVNPENIEKAIRSNTSVLVLSAANAETGVLNDFQAAAEIAEKYNLACLIDAAAFIGKKPFIFYKGISATVLSAHKIHGPKGSAALILRKNTPCRPLITGGQQEHGKRAGTENLAGILGLAKALELACANLQQHTAKMQFLRDLFEERLICCSRGFYPFKIEINGSENRICNVSNLYFEGVPAEDLLMLLDRMGVLAASGSACSSKAFQPSRIISNMYDKNRASSSVRFSFSRFNTEKEVETAAETVLECLAKLQKNTQTNHTF